MKRLIYIAAMAAVAALALPVTAQTVKIDSTGVKVTGVDGQKVTVDNDGTKVETEESKVEVKDSSSKTTVKTTKKAKPKPAAKVVAKSDRKPHDSFTCDKNDDIAVKDAAIAADVGFTTHGNCEVELDNVDIAATTLGAKIAGSTDVDIRNSRISSQGVGLEVSGSAEVELDNVDLAATGATITISGTGQVTIKNSRLSSAPVVKGMGKFIDGGGNIIGTPAQ